MSYQVLARKWRPRNFSELVGQEHVERALINALDNDRLHHAFLFTGTRGVGKTTIARILAKSLNCETNGVSSNPCGECSACVEIDEGRFVDLIEVDAASRTKVDETRELLDNVQYAPVHGRYKVYLIDEVHMLSKHSFNALLKTLEEPPPHIKFLLATTDPQKLPVTVLSRCLQFSLKRLPEGLITERIAHILSSEGIDFEAEALSLLAVAADGSLRDALSLVDQAIPYGNGAIRVAEVRDMLGTIDREHVFDLLDALVGRSAEKILAKIDEMDALAPDYAQVLDSLNDILQSLAIAKEVPKAIAGRSDSSKLLALAERLPKESIQLFYQIALHGRRDLHLSPTSRGGFEMTMLRLLAFEPERDDRVAEKKTVKSRPTPLTDQSAARTNAETSRLDASLASEAFVSMPAKGPQVAVVHADARKQALKPENEQQPKPPTLRLVDKKIATQASSPVKLVETEESKLNITDWISYYQSLPLKGAVKQLAKHCVVTDQQDANLYLLLDEDVAPMLSASLQQDLESVISEQQGFGVKLNIAVGSVALPTPAKREKEERNKLQHNAVAAIENDPFVQELKRVFDAKVDSNSIKPRT